MAPVQAPEAPENPEEKDPKVPESAPEPTPEKTEEKSEDKVMRDDRPRPVSTTRPSKGFDDRI